MLEGKCHLDTVVSLPAGARLHALRSASVASAAAPVDPVEEGELINAFCMVYSMHNLWDTLGPTAVVFDRDDQRIDTPWPMNNCRNINRSSTVRNFLFGAPSSSGYGNSLITKYTKASILFSRTNSLANISSGDMNSSVRQQLIASSRNLDTHRLFHHANSRTKSLAAARVAIELFPVIDALRQHSDVIRVPTLNLMFGVLLGIVGRVVLKEIGRLRWSGSGSRSAAVGTQLRELEEMLGALVTTMQGFSGYAPFMGEFFSVSGFADSP
ncbi:hypothetical protein L218DRAFT_1005209 [Marasmius fiardii PR-910]|nr:hypothetical protein L218DRAFT_1005209 [Marasmius fiardii PR-910]